MATDAGGSDEEYALPSSPPLREDDSQHDYIAAERGETFLTRPNRYFGPDSSWLSWTKHDRLAAQYIDQSRSQDLSLHLLNAHKLSRKASLEEVQVERSRKGKERAVADTSDSDEGQVISLIPRRWTSWPLPPSQVPRRHQGTKQLYSKGIQTRDKPSRELEESLVATTTRMARKRWQVREWDKVSADTRNDGAPGDAKATNSHQTASESDTDAAETLQTDAEADEVRLDHSYALPSGTGHGDDSKFESDTYRMQEGDVYPPTPIADEEQTYNMLLASSRHALSKLDTLLMGLHKARNAYAGTRQRQRSQDDPKGTASEQDRSSRSRSRSRSRRTQRSRSRLADSSQNKHPLEGPKRQERFGLRDWSDVLGMASMTDWDPEVVQRASERCATMFGENMLFRTFLETDTYNDVPNWRSHNAAESLASSDTEQAVLSSRHQIIRTSQPCQNCRKARHKCEPNPSQPGSRHCLRCTRLDLSCTRINTSVAAEDTRCPYKSCERSRRPFSKMSRLNRHLHEVHDQDRSAGGVPGSGASSGPDDFAVATDQYMCPVLSCPRHSSGFNEGSKLYRHIRQMHAEVNVEVIKRLETQRRGERRGRWNNANHRMRPVGVQGALRLDSSPGSANSRLSGEDYEEESD